MTDFIIDKFGWHTKVKGNPETKEDIIKRFSLFANFLQNNALTARNLVTSETVFDDEFEIRSSDLTDEGLAVVKKCYDKWLKKIVNKRKDVSDISILLDSLHALRNS